MPAQGNALGSVVKTSQALKERDSGCAALSGLDDVGAHTQGVALGWHISPL
jgi:hypothetical protein